MKVLETIERVKALKPNAYDDKRMLGWLNDLEAMVQSEVLNIADGIIQYTLPEDNDTMLLIPKPYDGCYQFYVFAQMDFNNQETASYQNNQAMFNEIYSEYKKFHERSLGSNSGLKVRNFD